MNRPNPRPGSMGTIYVVENQGTFLGFIIKVAIAGFIFKLVLFG